jgi:hypothetical protein
MPIYALLSTHHLFSLFYFLIEFWPDLMLYLMVYLLFSYTFFDFSFRI